MSIARLCLGSSSLRLWYLIERSKKRKCSVSEINSTRRQFGEYNLLYKKLREQPRKFFEYLKISVSTFDYILNKIEPRMTRNWTNFNTDPIEPAARLLITLRYLVTGYSYRSLALSFRMGYSTVASIVKETTQIIWEVLQPHHMKIPNKESFSKIAKDFYELWDFPNCVGAIGGKHIGVKCPPKSGSLYHYKHLSSIVLQGVVDAKYRFVTIDVGGYDEHSDGGSFRSSSLFNSLENGDLDIPGDCSLPSTSIVMPHVIIGDEAYPLLQNLLKPYSRNCLDADKEYFNHRLSRARTVVERAFGMINNKWQILWKPIETTPTVVDSFVKCVCVLHNTILDLEGFADNEEMSPLPRNIRPSRSNSAQSAKAKRIRDAFKKFMCRNRI